MILTWRQDLRSISKGQQNSVTLPTPPSTSGGTEQLMLNRQKQLKAACKGEMPSLNVCEFEEPQTCVEDRIDVVSDYSNKLVDLDERLNDVPLKRAVFNTVIQYNFSFTDCYKLSETEEMK